MTEEFSSPRESSILTTSKKSVEIKQSHLRSLHDCIFLCGLLGGRKFRVDTKVKSSFNYPWGHSLRELVLGINGGSCS